MTDTLALYLYTRQFQALINGGMNLVSCLALLAREAPAPYAEAADVIRTRLFEGETISGAYARQPELFPRFYMLMTRVGEYCGILDEMLAHQTEMLAEELAFNHAQGLAPSLVLPTPPDEQLAMLRFCRTFSVLLQLGLPVPLSLEVAAETQSEPRLSALRAAVQAGPPEDAVVRIVGAAVLAPLATQLLHMGVLFGELAWQVTEAAALYHDQLGALLGVRVPAPAPVARVIDQLPPMPAEDARLAVRGELEFFAQALREAGYPHSLPPFEEDNELANPFRALLFRMGLLAIQRGFETVTVRGNQVWMGNEQVRVLPDLVSLVVQDLLRGDAAKHPDSSWGLDYRTLLVHTAAVTEGDITISYRPALRVALAALDRDGDTPAALVDRLLELASEQQATGVRLAPESDRRDVVISLLHGDGWQELLRLPAGANLIWDIHHHIQVQAGARPLAKTGLSGAFSWRDRQVAVEIMPITFALPREGGLPISIKMEMLTLTFVE